MTSDSTSGTGADLGDLASQFLTLNQHLGSGGDPSTALQTLVELAVASVPACDWAAITVWPREGRPRSVASTGDVASDADQLQYDLGQGPCLTAAAEAEMVRVPDAGTDRQWPKFSAAVVSETSARAVLSFHLAAVPHPSALNLYAMRPDSFDTDQISTAALFAAHARVLMIHAAAADKAANLTHALASSRQIGAAIGILMNVHKVTAEGAFDMLRRSSMDLHRKLRDIATDVTDTGALPRNAH